MTHCHNCGDEGTTYSCDCCDQDICLSCAVEEYEPAGASAGYYLWRFCPDTEDSVGCNVSYMNRKQQREREAANG